MEEKSSEKIIIEQLSQDLEDLESYLRDLWQFLPLPVCYLNPLLIILDVNLALEKFFGFPSIELIGKNVEIFFAKKDLVQRIFQKVTKKEKIVRQEGEVLTKKGKRIVNILASLRKDSQGDIIGYYLAFSDITELKKLQLTLEKKVKERTKELQEKVEELEKFQKLAIGRELKMIELKEELKKYKRSEAPVGEQKSTGQIKNNNFKKLKLL